MSKIREGTFRGIYFRTNQWRASQRTLIFVHGLSGSSSAWVEFEKKFAPRFNLLVFDLRGHGRSAKSTRAADFAIPVLARDLFELIRFLKIKKPILVGHSFGSLVVLEFLARHPRSAAGVILLSSRAEINSRGFAGVVRGFLVGVNALVPKLAAPRPGRHIDYSKYIGTGDWNLRRMIADVDNTKLKIFLQCTLQSYGFDRLALLPRIKIPTLIMHGARDTIFPAKYGKKMAAEIPGAKFVLVDSADHILVLNHFPRVSAEITQFLTRKF